MTDTQSGDSVAADEPVGPVMDLVDVSPEPPPLSDSELVDLGRRLHEAVLATAPQYTRTQILELAGISADEADEVWRALGFAIPEEDDVVFSDVDATALKTAWALVRDGLITEDNMLAFARLLGQQVARTAESQAQWALERVVTDPSLLEPDDLVRTITELVPVIESLQNHVWRRHIAMSIDRTFANASAASGGMQHMVVGFVDLSGYTNFSRKVGPVELAEELEEFEYLAAYLAAENHGRVVKSLGDEVLFVTETAVDAAEIALGLIERTEVDEHRLPVHVGLASGDVLPRLGDVFGPVVNLASRLTKAARPGTVLVDRALAEELADNPAYELQRVRGLMIRNYPEGGATRLRRHEEGDRPHRDLAAIDIVKRLRVWE